MHNDRENAERHYCNVVEALQMEVEKQHRRIEIMHNALTTRYIETHTECHDQICPLCCGDQLQGELLVQSYASIIPTREYYLKRKRIVFPSCMWYRHEQLMQCVSVDCLDYILNTLNSHGIPLLVVEIIYDYGNTICVREDEESQTKIQEDIEIEREYFDQMGIGYDVSDEYYI
eukprot:148693_1